MQTSKTSLTKKLVVGLVLGAGLIVGLSSSACSVTVSNTCPGGEIDCNDGTCGFADNVACTFDSDCCSNFCASDGFCGVGGACIVDLAACNFDSDCCSGICANGDGLCGCVLTNETGCATDSDCCSAGDLCIGGVCQ